MPNRAVPPEEVQRIKVLWRDSSWWQDPSRPPTARELWQRDGKKWSERKYQQIVQQARQEVKEVPADPPLTPWGKDWPKNNADAVDCLFRLRYQAMRIHPGLLTTRVGKWALRLRKLFTGAVEFPEITNPDRELLLHAYKYAQRERACESLGIPPYTNDLDGALTFRRWESSARDAEYREAVNAGLVPPDDPLMDARHEAALYGWENVMAVRLEAVFRRQVDLQETDDEALHEMLEVVLGRWLEQEIGSLRALVQQTPEARTAFRKVAASFQERMLPSNREVFQGLVHQIDQQEEEK